MYNGYLGKFEIDKISKFRTLLFVSLPLLRYYIPGISFLMFSDLAQVYLMFTGIVSRYQTKQNIPIYNAFLAYGAFVFAQTILSALYMPVYDIATNITTVTRMLIQVFLIVFASDVYFDKDFGISAYIKITCFHSLLITCQLIAFLGAGLRTSFLIPFLNAEAGYNNGSIMGAREFRPTGLLYEPAQTAHYCIPSLVISLFSNLDEDGYRNKKSFLCAIIVSLGLISSRSGTAIMLMAFVWGTFCVVYFWKTRSTKSIMFIILIVIVGIGLTMNPVVATSIERGTNVNSASGSTRVIRSFLNWVKFPVFYKIFGIGYSNYGAYVRYAGFQTIYDFVQDVGYSNAGGEILGGVGIIGALLYLRIYYRLIKKPNLAGKCITILLFVSLFYSGIVKGVYFPMYITLVFALNRYGSSRNEQE